jgi:uncharacterized protein DUF3175
MAHAITSGSKRKGGKLTGRGGLGGPGGRGGRRWALRELDLHEGTLHDIQHLSARQLAEAVKDSVEREPPTQATQYRRAMSVIADYADRESKRMKPEVRKKLADAKRELRDLYDLPQTSYGKGGPGKERHKPKAKSRRTPRSRATSR